MGARKHRSFGNDLAHRLGVAAIDAKARVKNAVAHNVLLEMLEGFGHFLRCWRSVFLRINEGSHNLVLGLGHRFHRSSFFAMA